MKLPLPLLLLVAGPALADGTRQLDAHEHGVGTLNIAVDGTTVAMEFHAPGADIVGFEYAAESAEDRAAIDTAVARLAQPLELFVMPAAAECSVTEARAGLETGDAHEGHEDHAEEDNHAHDHDHDHGEEGHEDHADEASTHTEFHSEYSLTCANPSAISDIQFAYFDAFENAREVEVQIISATGAQAFEVERDAPILDLRGMF